MRSNCAQCGNEFSSRPSEKRKFCGHSCYRAYEEEHGRPSGAEPIRFECRVCGTPFSRNPGEITQYRKTFGKDPMYCSRRCGGIGRSLKADDLKTNCIQCGKEFVPDGIAGSRSKRRNSLRRLCSTECRSLFRSLRSPSKFAEGEYSRHVKKTGYVWISIPAHAGGTGKKRQMMEHRYVMEKALGRPLLSEETVHHRNGRRAQNDLDNLELRSGNHGPGGDVSAMIKWAHEFITAYPQFDAEGNFHPVDGGEHAVH